MDSLKRYCSKGQQPVRVERMNVKSGGQVVVGNVTRRDWPPIADYRPKSLLISRPIIDLPSLAGGVGTELRCGNGDAFGAA